MSCLGCCEDSDGRRLDDAGPYVPNHAAGK